MIVQKLPSEREVSVEDIIAEAHLANKTQLAPASKEANIFCTLLSEFLLHDPLTKDFPELRALGFWLRPASVAKMVKEYLSASWQAEGIVFQIPPGNVDALFGYTLAISLLAGNISIIRLPRALRPAQDALVASLRKVLSESPTIIQQRIILIRYGHDDEVTAILSANCNVRMVWGNDTTISHISRFPLSAGSRAINFGNRFSSSTVSVAAYLNSNEDEKQQVVENFFNDLYWFDQMACSSPRLLLWVGDSWNFEEVSEDFYFRLSVFAKKKSYTYGLGESAAKINMHYLALHDLNVERSKYFGPELLVLQLRDFTGLRSFKSVNFGYGMLLAARVKELADFACHIDTIDQTLTVWGFDQSDVDDFCIRSSGKGFDRVVPVGQALQFGAVWDGINLFQAMTKNVEEIL